MKEETTEHVQIIFKSYSDLFEQEIEEPLWAFVLDKENRLYQIDSIPFYTSLIASNDIVFADIDPATKQLVYQKTVSYGGHSTVQVVMNDESIVMDDIRDIFSNMRCVSEVVNDDFFVLDIPDDVDYKQVKTELDRLEAEEKIEYAEPSLSDVHRKQTEG
ncbi:DUF4265 domain-containing protein [Pontibacter sp. KCTC 32443]|uniref:DUF4265 domain-containing protein n=1 Tax=Pontibacter TaxID=323449 RepID=UPI00164D0C6E|nr:MULTISPECIES: DUF4265 domain-containing protein [Pontibacter]MBC5774588.1 DUF4265 domain-containing protein [Pontibacter sp. KCTC 32443]